MALRTLPPTIRARGVTAVLGPTNTGKTHLAIERLVAHDSGMIGLPLRLLAREVYQRVVEKVGADAVALVTGEEKIKPPRARYWIATVEAMPRDLDVAFCAIDEIQLAADFDRGHVFTDRLLNQRGRAETLVIGAATMRPVVEALLPGAHIVARPRLSKLSFAGEKKITRLPGRSAIVAFSAEEVYAVAELIRRQKGGAAVVLGALSPRTRNAQVELFQSGDVDYLVATDAIGMGLNLDLDHVAFASDRKFDGHGFRRLNAAEFGQIAGRAGRYMRDGTFGTTGRCPAFDAELVEAIEDHAFEPVRQLQWRNPDVDTRSLARLQASLAMVPRENGLTRAPVADDVAVLEIAAHDEEVRALAGSPAEVARLWEACQVPDYRKVSPHAHADLVITLFRAIAGGGRLNEDWFARQIAQVDRTDGDIDTLSARIAHIRTWTFVANRPDWLADPEHWQGRARQVEDRLSDALHERLASRFVDRRTSVLMRRLRENAHMEAEVTPAGDVSVEGQHVGHLRGFHFLPDPQADGPEAKALRAAAQKALAAEIEARADRFAAAGDELFVLSNDGTIRWMGDAVARLVAGDKLLEPRCRLVADEQLTGPARDKVEARLDLWLKAHIAKLLGPLATLEEPAEISGLARGIAFQVAEALGVLERSRVAQDVKALDQTGRAQLRKLGLRFGAYHIYLPALLKPAPRALAVQLWALKHGGLDAKGVDDLPHLASSGRTSIPVDTSIDKALYRAAGFRVCGGRAVRVDILERLADLIRPAVTYRPGVTTGEPPPGTADGDGFVVTVSMTSLVGCSGEDFASILRSLGYVVESRQGPAITAPLVPKAETAPAAPAEHDAEAEVAVATDAGAAVAEGGAEPAAAEEVDAAGTEDLGEVGHDEVAEPVSAEAQTAEAAAAEPAVSGDQTASSEPEAVVTGDAAAEAGAEPGESAGPVEGASAAADGSTGEAAATASDGETTPGEPETIEVWRPHRQGHNRQQRPGRGRQGQDGHRRGGGRGGHGGHGQAERQGDVAAATATVAGAGDDRRRFERGPREQDGQGERRPRPEGDRSGPRRDQRRAEGRPGRPDRDERGGRRGDDAGGNRGNWRGDRGGERRFAGPRPEKGPDPDSPFAKLLLLKERMETGDKS